MKGYYSLDELREIIPDFDLRCENYILSWIEKMELRRVVRMGYWKMGFYGDKWDKLFVVKEINGQKVMFLPDDMPFTDLEHVAGYELAVCLFKDFFGQFIPMLYGIQPDWMDKVEEGNEHEIGENRIGDWTDDRGHEPELKNRLEQEAYDAHMVRYPFEAQIRHQKQFAAVRDGTTMGKLFDKQAFLNGIAYFKSKGVTGSLEEKVGITKHDIEICKKTGSERPIDNIYAGLLLNNKATQPLLPFFMGINEATYRLFYNEFDPTVKGCVPGEVPPGVKQFY